MGWGSGSSLMGAVIQALDEECKDATARQKIYRMVINAFEDHDWDCQDECLGIDPAFDKALKGLHPDWDIY